VNDPSIVDDGRIARDDVGSRSDRLDPEADAMHRTSDVSSAARRRRRLGRARSTAR
jgi:hypothetical protein